MPIRSTKLAVIAACVGAAVVATCPTAIAASLQAGAVPVVINEVLASNGLLHEPVRGMLEGADPAWARGEREKLGL